jgi:hypothetical protein
MKTKKVVKTTLLETFVDGMKFFVLAAIVTLLVGFGAPTIVKMMPAGDVTSQVMAGCIGVPALLVVFHFFTQKKKIEV